MTALPTALDELEPAETPGASRYAPDWLALREPADAAARAPELLDRCARFYVPRATPAGRPRPGLRHRLAGPLARRRLRGPQHWVLHDRDPALLAAPARMPARPPTAARSPPSPAGRHHLAARGRPRRHVAGHRLRAARPADRRRGRGARRGLHGGRLRGPAALSVVGRVLLTPPTRSTPSSPPPSTPTSAADGAGCWARTRSPPPPPPSSGTARVRRGRARGGSAPQAALTAEWLRGWVAAACDQQPELAAEADAYLRRRLDACAAGGLQVVVHHVDLLALPGAARGHAWPWPRPLAGSPSSPRSCGGRAPTRSSTRSRDRRRRRARRARLRRGDHVFSAGAGGWSRAASACGCPCRRPSPTTTRPCSSTRCSPPACSATCTAP